MLRKDAKMTTRVRSTTSLSTLLLLKCSLTCVRMSATLRWLDTSHTCSVCSVKHPVQPLAAAPPGRATRSASTPHACKPTVVMRWGHRWRGSHECSANQMRTKNPGSPPHLVVAKHGLELLAHVVTHVVRLIVAVAVHQRKNGHLRDAVRRSALGLAAGRAAGRGAGRQAHLVAQHFEEAVHILQKN